MAKKKETAENKPLTDKQKAFVTHYCGDAKWDATKAAVLAKYSKKTARQIGSQNLSKLNIQAEIKKKQQSLQKKADITADEVIQELKAIGFSDVLNYVGVDKKRISISDWSKLTKAQRAAIAEVSETAGKKGKRYLKFKLHNKLEALDKLCKYLGLYVERVIIGNEDTLSDEECEEIRQLLRTKHGCSK
jgi:phage terminase small subunit